METHMFRIYLVNFGYFLSTESDSLDSAKEQASKAGFESCIYCGDNMVATYSQLYGFRTL
jgi:hypothetical protein